jgi:DNA polymerase III epsilon subunit-like protein
MYSDNLIFLDTEFTNLDPKVGELLSIGLVTYNGKELYLELEYDKRGVHPWVEKNVIPKLQGNPISNEKARKKLLKFIGTPGKKSNKPFMMAYVNQFDAVYWYKLFDSPKEHPLYWIPMDFASILFAHGFDPNSMGKKKFFDLLGIDKEAYKLHNALDDAKLLREMYLKFEDYIKK